MIDPNDLASQFALHLRSIGQWSKYERIYRITILVGERYQVDPAELKTAIVAELKKQWTAELDGAVIEIVNATAGMQFEHPQTGLQHTATGWELFLLDFDGSEF
ncbi:MAG: hypothetical protein HN909_01845 [Phycisphaerales bacterium]|jgi:hypothetical protein|nr:hypothetical protein [Phycisphaerales bacterium]MBT7170491.1 hypothetical protein [Phycisphaerales bacterium]